MIWSYVSPTLNPLLLEEGYELEDLVGKEWDKGMNLQADFIPDPNLKEGENIIDQIYEPQIMKDGKLIL